MLRSRPGPRLSTLRALWLGLWTRRSLDVSFASKEAYPFSEDPLGGSWRTYITDPQHVAGHFMATTNKCLHHLVVTWTVQVDKRWFRVIIFTLARSCRVFQDAGSWRVGGGVHRTVWCLRSSLPRFALVMSPENLDGNAVTPYHQCCGVNSKRLYEAVAAVTPNVPEECARVSATSRESVNPRWRGILNHRCPCCESRGPRLWRVMTRNGMENLAYMMESLALK